MTAGTQPALIETAAALQHLADQLAREPLLGFDTEAASFHRFTDRVYLIQVSSRSLTAVVDPLAAGDLTPLGSLLSDPAIEVVFHDADFDLRSLDRDYGFRVRRVFDTRIAAQLLGEPGVGLGALLEKHFSVKLNKKLQRADWSQRPLTREMVAYAAADTAHLPALRDQLYRELEARNRLSWADEEFARLEAIRWGGPGDGEAYLRIKGARLLPPRGLVVLRQLHAWRDDQARALDRATFRIMGNESLMGLAQRVPTSRAEILKVPELPATLAERYAGQLLDQIRAALDIPEREWPRLTRRRGQRPDPEIELRFDRLKQLRNDRARALGIEPGVLCPNGTLEAMARTSGTSRQEVEAIPELRRWQREALELDSIMAALQGPPTAAG